MMDFHGAMAPSIGGVMHAARLAIVILLVLAVIVASTPQAREQVMGTWEKFRPAMVSAMDSLYLSVLNFISDHGSRNRIYEVPAPNPGERFERIVTLRSGFSL